MTESVGAIDVRRRPSSWPLISRLLVKVLLYLVLIALAIVFMLPLVWMISSSLKEEWEIFVVPPNLLPQRLKWENYSHAFTFFDFWRYAANTVIYTVGVIVGRILSASMVAFGFAYLRFRGRDVLFILLLSTLMVPFQVTLIPVYLGFRTLGWLNTLLPLIVPAYFGGGAFYIFLLRQFFLSISRELADAARIDGCSTFGIYSRIILPLSREALATVAIFSFMATWNDFLGPLIYLSDPDNYTLPVALQFFRTMRGNVMMPVTWSDLMVVSLVVMLPCVVVFFFAQRVFIQGVVVTGVKG